MIGILDYGAGNINAISRIYNNLNIPNLFIREHKDYDKVEKIILPGVGAFDAVMTKLNSSGLKDGLNANVMHQKKPVFGICVGLQIMAKSSDEGDSQGLGWIDAHVKKFDFKQKLYVPHMGWNSITLNTPSNLYDNVDKEFGFYFVHSYYLDHHDQLDLEVKTQYGNEYTSGFKKGNIMATQFHPEKSHSNGIELLKNFAQQDIC